MTARIVELEDEVTTAPAAPAVGPTVFIATPAYGCLLTAQYMQCLLQTQLTLGGRGISVVVDMLGNESLITRARNVMTKRFLQSTATHLLFIDADISWDPEAIVRLLAKNEGVVSTSYPKKFLDWKKLEERLAQPDSTEPLQQAGLDFNLNVSETHTQVTDGFAEVLDAATGFLLVRRDVIEAMYKYYEKELLVVNDLMGAKEAIKDYVAIFDCMVDPVSRRSLSEDFAFSRRWQTMGGKVYMDLLAPLGHTGGFHYEGTLADRLTAVGGRDAVRSGPVDEPINSDNKGSVLMAILPHDGRVSLGFCMSITQLVAAIQQANAATVQVRVFGGKNQACDWAWANPTVRAVVLMDGMLGFDSGLVLDMLRTDVPLAVAAVPRDFLNWQNVARLQGEPVSSRGMEYDVELGPNDADGDWVQAVHANLGLAKIDRSVLQAVSERVDPRAVYDRGTRRMWFHQGILDDRRLEEDELFCRVWGGPVHVNIRHRVNRLGDMTFTGVVMARKHLR